MVDIDAVLDNLKRRGYGVDVRVSLGPEATGRDRKILGKLSGRTYNLQDGDKVSVVTGHGPTYASALSDAIDQLMRRSYEELYD